MDLVQFSKRVFMFQFVYTYHVTVPKHQHPRGGSTDVDVGQHAAKEIHLQMRLSNKRFRDSD